MVYCSTGNLERLFIHPYDDIEERHWVDIAQANDAPTFSVTCCCNDEWVWEFWYDKTNYDLIKHVIMDCIFEAEDMNDLIDAMDEAFEEFFSDIVVETAELQEGEFECDGDCANCSFNEDKYLN